MIEITADIFASSFSLLAVKLRGVARNLFYFFWGGEGIKVLLGEGV